MLHGAKEIAVEVWVLTALGVPRWADHHCANNILLSQSEEQTNLRKWWKIRYELMMKMEVMGWTFWHRQFLGRSLFCHTQKM